MKSNDPQRRPTVVALALLLLIALAAAALLAGCSGAAVKDDSDTEQGTPLTPGAETGSDAVQKGQAVGYFLSSEKLAPARMKVRTDDLEGTLKALVAGAPKAAEEASCTSAIPEGTRVLGVSVDGDTATADLSPEFASGGGAQSMQLRVAQVVFTLTRDPKVKKVVFEIEGEPVTALGGEGLVLTDAQTRADWEAFSPEVLIETPVIGDVVDSPLVVAGTARLPADRLKLAIAGADGFQVTSASATSTAEAGKRGAFKKPLTFELPAGPAMLIASFPDPGGGRVESMRVPLRVK